MKKKIFLFSLSIILISGGLSSCSHDDSVSLSDQDGQGTTFTAPTADALEVTSALKTYVYDGDYNDEGKAIINRIKDRASTLSSDVKTIILPASKISSLTSDDYLAITAAYMDNTNLLITKPNLTQFKQLFTGMNQAAETLISAYEETTSASQPVGSISAGAINFIKAQANNLQASSRSTTPYNPIFSDEQPDENTAFCEVMGFNDDDCYFMKPLKAEEEITDINPIINRDQNGNVISTENKVITTKHVMSAYEYGQYADEAVTWLNQLTQAETNSVKEKNMGRMLASRADVASTDLTNDDDAQKSTFTVNARSRYYVGDAAATVTYYIWRYHKIKSGDDLYILHSEVSMPSGDLACGRMPNTYGDKETIAFKEMTKLDDESSAFKTVRLYGPFLRNLEVKNEFAAPGSGSVILQSHSPKTEIGSTNYKCGYTLSANGGVSSEEGLSLTLGGSYTKEWNYNIKDLKTTDMTSGTTQSCKFAGNFEDYSGSFRSNYPAVKPILRSTAVLPSVAAWTVTSPSEQNCQLTMSGNIQVGCQKLSYCYYGFWLYTYSDPWDMDNTFTQTINILLPPHYSYTWSLYVKDGANSKKLENYLLTTYPTLFTSTINYYETTKGGGTDAEKYPNSLAKWNELIKEVKNANDMGTIKGKGIPAGTYTICMDGQSGNPVQLTYTLTVK